ncbi:M6 family metalloprotease domain-containing protein [Clostridium swellfunianum]|uniref:M6 family metalloprotease domain-containing protein n=1 Tax=Clostridium swellfunianum TaxID=1367462 RepID=UPI00202FAEFB|nr:M6 family metalloprotease domain-containing protein [Clostridium swellfunianum]MCM0647512.1 M6 family metalloprotease domain-containing protein [Clostridium swellfunianum]
MKRKPLALLVSLTMLFSIAATGGSSQKVEGASASTPKKFVQTLPSYQKLDKELQAEARAKGLKVEGKDLKGYNGKAYIKPGNIGPLTPLDVTGKDKKGIAILVDFPVENKEGKISDVPGVNYPQIPVNQFEGLLNGSKYDPYQLNMFSWIKTEAEKLGITVPTNRTLNNYYKEVSYDQFKINVDVKGWYTLPKPYSYYLKQGEYYNDNGDAHIGELIADAIDLADKAGVDFSQYAVDAKAGDFADLYGDATATPDGIKRIVPNIFVIHRGTGAEYSQDPSIIWSHKWDILSASYYGQYYQTGSYPEDSSLSYKVVDGVVVNTYNICPEVGQDITEYYTKPAGIPKREPSPVDPGVFAHEFGHVLGLPDQYDYGYDSEGTGMFTLMAGGSYGRDIDTGNKLLNRYFSGFSPVHMDAWSKYYLGFMQPKVITKESLSGKTETITLQPVAQSTAPNYYKIVVPGSNGKEYFLLENRQQLGYDKGLAYTVDGKNLHGLVIYHVDENVLVRNFHRPNEAANWDWNNRGANYRDKETGENHYGISVVQADGRWDMEKYINDGDSGDVFPGTAKVTALTPSIKSSINTTSYYKWGTDSRSYTGITIDNIVEGKNGVITARVYFK